MLSDAPPADLYMRPSASPIHACRNANVIEIININCNQLQTVRSLTPIISNIILDLTIKNPWRCGCGIARILLNEQQL